MINLITIARYAEKKKGYDLIPKVAELIYKKTDFKWTIVGRGTQEILKFHFIREHKNNFNIIPEINDTVDSFFPSHLLIEILKKNDLYVNLSRIESFGVTIIEAMAAGLPVISFNTKGVNELIVNQKNGFLIQENNFEEYANKILSFANKKDYLEQKSFNKMYLKKFDLEEQVKIIINTYNELKNS